MRVIPRRHHTCSQRERVDVPHDASVRTLGRTDVGEGESTAGDGKVKRPHRSHLGELAVAARLTRGPPGGRLSRNHHLPPVLHVDGLWRRDAAHLVCERVQPGATPQVGPIVDGPSEMRRQLVILAPWLLHPTPPAVEQVHLEPGTVDRRLGRPPPRRVCARHRRPREPFRKWPLSVLGH
eukprot:3035518-Prymnesium_polylepis.1